MQLGCSLSYSIKSLSADLSLSPPARQNLILQRQPPNPLKADKLISNPRSCANLDNYVASRDDLFLHSHLDLVMAAWAQLALNPSQVRKKRARFGEACPRHPPQ